MIKCSHCGKEIISRGKLISCDGNFVCNEECHRKFCEQMDRIYNMTDKEFKIWMYGGDENEKRK